MGNSLDKLSHQGILPVPHQNYNPVDFLANFVRFYTSMSTFAQKQLGSVLHNAFTQP
jgi:hypothetical protein